MTIAKAALGIATGLAGLAALGIFVVTDMRQGTGLHAADAAAAAKPMGIPVPVTAVVRKTVPIYADFVGRTEAIRNVTLQARATGYLIERGAADGADVKSGDLLYRIDPRDYDATLDQLKAQAERGAAALAYARSNSQRGDQLVKGGWMSRDANDQRDTTLRQAEAQVAADEAAIRAAEINRTYTEIRAPFAGRLSRSLVHEGALISAAGTQLNTLIQLDPLYVTFNPSETDLTRIESARAKGKVTAEVTLTGAGEHSFRGTLSFLDNTVDRTTGTITARATIDNPEHTLLPGQFVRVRLHLGEEPDAQLVPQAALGSSQLGKYVYVVGDGNKVEQRLVSLGATHGSLVAVGKGVSVGELVIVGNLQKIGPGAPVQPLPTNPAGS
jgi:membrane fusion protein, multidrug efflux system